MPLSKAHAMKWLKPGWYGTSRDGIVPALAPAQEQHEQSQTTPVEPLRHSAACRDRHLRLALFVGLIEVEFALRASRWNPARIHDIGLASRTPKCSTDKQRSPETDCHEYQSRSKTWKGGQTLSNRRSRLARRTPTTIDGVVANAPRSSWRSPGPVIVSRRRSVP
jgi:hypothetical protein